MNHRNSTLIAVLSVLATVGVVAAVLGPSNGNGAGAAALVAPPTTVAAGPSDSSTPSEPADPVPPASEQPAPAAPEAPTSLPAIIPPTAPDAFTGFTKIDPPAVPIEAVGSADGDATQRLQQRLLDLGFWLPVADGKFGKTTKQAVMAFQKYNLVEATGDVDATTAQMMNEMPIRATAAARTGDLVEINKATQLLFIVRAGVTVWVFNASTGNGLPYEEEDQNSPGEIARGVALTPDGNWKVNREKPEGWWEGDLGRIYRPKYFYKGIAVHGSGNVPNYPASHGCVRVSTTAMDFIWDNNLMPMKSKVWVHA